jgi:hypothetical protein
MFTCFCALLSIILAVTSFGLSCNFFMAVNLSDTIELISTGCNILSYLTSYYIKCNTMYMANQATCNMGIPIKDRHLWTSLFFYTRQKFISILDWTDYSKFINNLCKKLNSYLSNLTKCGTTLLSRGNLIQYFQIYPLGKDVQE